MQQASYRMTRLLYILEASFEYFISVIVSGAYLARVCTTLQLSDGVTGILSSLTSLGCVFQFFAIFASHKKSVKRYVIVLHLINQLAFTVMYVTPFFPVPHTVKIVAFILLLLIGNALNNTVNATKITWLMTMVPNGNRGRFTANKEIVSLLSGIVFTYLTGTMIDVLEANGNDSLATILCGVTLLLLTVLHTLTLVLSRERPSHLSNDATPRSMLRELLKNRSFLRLLPLYILWFVATYSITPFTGTYTIKELGFSMMQISLINAASSVLRAVFSQPLGRFADRRSFPVMLNICYTVALISFAVNIFTVPKNGILFYSAYSILYAVSMAGINSGEINLIYDNVPNSHRSSALALKSTVAGLCGFLTTLLISPLVTYIQENGNKLFGIPVYAQQVTSVIGTVATALALLYLNLVIRKARKATKAVT